MKKFSLVLVAVIIAASPALAATKQKKMTKQEAEAAEIAKQHDRRALRDSLPLVLPSWSLPIFFGMKMDEKLKEGDKAAKK